MKFRALVVMVSALASVGLDCSSHGWSGREEPGLRVATWDYHPFDGSLGAQIHEVSASRLATLPHWPVDPRPAHIIGDAVGGGRFKSLSYALRLPDGGFLGADAEGRRVLSFNRDGGFRGTWTSPQDRGGFDRPTWLGLCGDSVHVYDGATRLVHVFSVDGRYARTYQPMISSKSGIRYPVHPARPLACNRAGTVAALAAKGKLSGTDSGGGSDVALGPYRGVELLGLGDRTGDLRTITQVPGEDRYRYPTGTGPLFGFARKPRVALSNDRVFLETGDAYEIASYGLGDRQWVLVRAVGLPRRPVAAAEILQVKRQALSDPALSERTRTGLSRLLDGMTWPAFHPMIGGLLVDSRQCLWVEDGYETGTSRGWVVLSRNGRPLGHVLIPRTLELIQVDEERLIGRQQVGTGVIAVFRVRRPGGQC